MGVLVGRQTASFPAGGGAVAFNLLNGASWNVAAAPGVPSGSITPKANDPMYVMVHSKLATPVTWTFTAGWTQVATGYNNAGVLGNVIVLTRLWQPGDPPLSVSASGVGSGNTEWGEAVILHSNSSGSPSPSIDGTQTATSPAATSFAAASLSSGHAPSQYVVLCSLIETAVTSFGKGEMWLWNGGIETNFPLMAVRGSERSLVIPSDTFTFASQGYTAFYILASDSSLTGYSALRDPIGLPLDTHHKNSYPLITSKGMRDPMAARVLAAPPWGPAVSEEDGGGIHIF